MLKIALLGYGKMGKEIEAIARERGHIISLIIDIDNWHELTLENLKQIDVAIDFSIPESAFGNINSCFDAGVPVVCGTTGWLGRKQEVVDRCRSEGKGFFYASNYSIGVNIFFRINQYLARLMNDFQDYDVHMEEVHHTQKLDAPSGTAITLAEGIVQNLERKIGWQLSGEPCEKPIIPIKAIREGSVPGTHIVTYDSAIDYLTISHVAKGRRGFAYGAVLAAEFIAGRQGIYGMDDLLKLNDN